MLVLAVAHATPAAQAGLRQGDEIRRVGRRAVTNRFDVERAIWDSRPGEPVTVQVLRQGQELTVDLALTDAPGAEHVASWVRR